MEAYNQKKTIMHILSALCIIIGIGIIVSPLFTAVTGPMVSLLCLLIGAMVIAAAVLISTNKFIDFLSRFNLSKLCVPISLAAIIGAIIIEVLPFSYVMGFAAPPGEEPYYEYVSYFDLLPMGYGNWFPLLTAISSCISAILVIILLINLIFQWYLKRKAAIKGKAAVICTSISAFFAILATLLITSKITSYGIIIMLLLILSVICQFVQYKNR